MKNKISTLIVDDETELRKSLSVLLQTQLSNYEFVITEASTGTEALEKIATSDFDLVLMDVKMPGMTGLEALAQIKQKDPSIFVVIMTAHSNLQDAVIAIRDGAYDYLEKPVNPQRLSEIIKKSLEAREMVSDLAVSNPIFDDDLDSEFVGHSQKMRTVFDLIYRLCRVDTTVLIRGENGTGKELVARAIHYNSPRKDGPFIAVNCGAISENLIESEFFGHEKGSFTGAHERKIGKFQLANNGTLFLDEIGELKPEMQATFLRVLQDKKFTPVGGNREAKTNTRIIAATNRNLEKMIADGSFREDLFYRLNVMPIFLPPLRERLDDLEALTTSFIKNFKKAQPKSGIKSLSLDALDVMKKHNWPGNIRELENAIERAFIMESSSEITVKSLPDFVTKPLAGKAPAEISSAPIFKTPVELNYEQFKEDSEKDFIISALKANKGKINQTVAQANIPKNTLLRKIKKYGLRAMDYSTKGSVEE